jgi:hypothetical protein
VASRLTINESGMGNQTTFEKKANKQCVHHWIIDKDNVGRCVKCGAVKDFGKLLGKAKGELNYLRGYPDTD